MQSREETRLLIDAYRRHNDIQGNYGYLPSQSSDSNAFDEANPRVQYIPGSLHQISSHYESLDYDPDLNSLSLDERRRMDHRSESKLGFNKWVCGFFIGLFTACIAFLIDICIETLSNLKYSLLQNQINRCYADSCLYIPLLLWLLMNGTATSIAGFLASVVESCSAGSGIPQVKCYLNGVKVDRIVRIKTLICKTVGVVFSVVGGLNVGKEGPMIHSGAVVAAGITQGKSSTFNIDTKWLTYFRNDKEKRDFVSMGAAAGVSAAFGAPISGLLFSLEEGASFWYQNLGWKIFFASIISTFSLNTLLSTWRGNLSDFSNNGLLNLGKFDDLTYKYGELPLFAIIAVGGGLLGAAFNQLNYYITVFRMRYMRNIFVKIFEAVFISWVTCSVAAGMIYFIGDCRDQDQTKTKGVHIRMYCKENQENTVALFLLQTPELCVRSLFHDPQGSFGWTMISVFFVVYFLLACWTYGSCVPSGLFIPSLLAGAAYGRMCGMFLGYLFPNQPWVDEGKYALVGAAAVLCGVVRMTISLTGILMECVGNITFGLPIMMVVLISKFVGDMFNEGIYDIHIKLMGIPYLPWEATKLTDNLFASEVMNQPVITLNTLESSEKIYSILKTCSHNGFPVVENGSPEDELQGKTYGKLRGLMLRSQLVILLKNKIFNENTAVWDGDLINSSLFRNEYPRFPTIDDVYLSPEDLRCTIDLRPFMNPSPYSLTSASSFQRIFNIFRPLGLRHLIILNDEHCVVGIVTRKDIVKFHVSYNRRGGASLGQLGIYDPPSQEF